MSATTWSRELVIKYLDQLRCRSGAEIVKLYKQMRTEHVSIQGPWHPFLNQPTDWNIKQFPDPEGLRALKVEKTATEIVMEMARAQGIPNIVEEKEDTAVQPADAPSTADHVARPVTATFSERWYCFGIFFLAFVKIVRCDVEWKSVCLVSAMGCRRKTGWLSSYYRFCLLTVVLFCINLSS